MSIVTPYIENLNNIKDQIPSVARSAIEENSEDIINVLKFSQLGIGLNSDGSPLRWSGGTGFYAPSTQNIANRDPRYSRQKPKGAGDPYNFQWSGETFAFMDLKFIGTDEYEIFTASGKQSFLESIYGEIFELTDAHNKWVNETIVLPAISDFILENMVVI